MDSTFSEISEPTGHLKPWQLGAFGFVLIVAVGSLLANLILVLAINYEGDTARTRVPYLEGRVEEFQGLYQAALGQSEREREAREAREVELAKLKRESGDLQESVQQARAAIESPPAISLSELLSDLSAFRIEATVDPDVSDSIDASEVLGALTLALRQHGLRADPKSETTLLFTIDFVEISTQGSGVVLCRLSIREDAVVRGGRGAIPVSINEYGVFRGTSTRDLQDTTREAADDLVEQLALQIQATRRGGD